MNKLKKLYYLLSEKLKSNREWTITGLFALFVLLSFGISYTLASRPSASSGDKKLPIYCVDTSEKKIAISFDAAWGDC